MITVHQTFITYFNHYFYVIGHINQQRVYQLQRRVQYLSYITSSVF